MDQTVEIDHMLYQFENLSRRLDEWGFPSLKAGSGFRIMKGIDFEQAYKAGSISFEDDGIYLTYGEEKYRGYMFIKEPWITVHESYPVFHLTKCSTIEKFIAGGKFKIRYEFSNSDVNDLIDITTKKVFKDEVLRYCGNCRKKLLGEIETTEDFYQTLDKNEIKNNKIEVDIFGYVRGMEKIGKAYKKKMNCQCASCKITPKDRHHERFWHIHHLDLNKTNNMENNLQCLCVLCYYHIDTLHENHFDRSRMRNEVNSFIRLYKDKLAVSNKYYSKRVF